jgi:hypothetical protein
MSTVRRTWASVECLPPPRVGLKHSTRTRGLEHLVTILRPFCDHEESCEAKPEVRGESFVETPQLRHGESTDSSTESLNVDGAELLDQDQRRLALDLDRRSKRCRSSASRRRSNDHDGSRQKLVRLHHDPETNHMLLVSEPLRDLEPKHLTPLHAWTP